MLYFYRAYVVKVIDGDTVKLDIDLGFRTWLREQNVRLIGVDTPEIRGEEREDGLIVKKYVSDILPVGKEILLNSFRDRKGKYGRWLGEIIVDNVSLNESLKRMGYEYIM